MPSSQPVSPSSSRAHSPANATNSYRQSVEFRVSKSSRSGSPSVENPRLRLPGGEKSLGEDIQYRHSGAGQPSVQIEEVATDYQPRKHWKSWKLSWLFNVPLIFLTVGLIASVIALDQVSAHHTGLATIPNFSDASFLVQFTHFQTYYGLLWTALPSFLFTLYALLWAAVVSGTADRQPFVELKRETGSTARRSILLDYRTYPSVYSWFVAFRNEHPHIGFGMIMSLLVSVAVVPLSAHLIVAQPASFASNVGVNPASTFDVSGITAKTNLQPFIDVATAVHSYELKPPPWMTTEYAFQRYSFIESMPSGNISFSTTAYSGLLDCQIIPSSQYSVVSGTADGAEGVDITISDRGCIISTTLPISSQTNLYAKTWSKPACGSDGLTRVGMLSGLYSSSAPQHLSEFTVTSCIPSYWSTTGLLTLSYTPGSKPTYVSFTNTNDTQLEVDLNVIFESPLTHYTIFDVTAATFADALGYAVYSASLASTPDQSQTAAMVSSSIQSSLENVYATIFAGLAKNVLLKPGTSLASETTQGTLTQSVTRLFVARPIAYVIIAVLLLVLACNILLFAYAQRHATSLEAEPVGLLGSAVLLRGGHDVFDVVDRARRSLPVGERDVVGHVKKELGSGKGEKCWWDEVEGKVRVEGVLA